MKPRLTISIVNHSNPHLLQECLRSLFRSAPDLEFDVWVIDNATDRRLVPEMQREFPKVRWVFNSERLGFSANHNQMLCQAESEYLCILNDDTVIKPGCMQALVEYLDGDPAAGVVGPRLLNVNGSVQHSVFREINLVQEAIETLILPGSLKRFKDFHIHPGAFLGHPAPVDHLLGACMVFRRRALLEAGVLDAAMSPIANIEDFDICHRLRVLGWTVVYCPTAVMTHIGGQSVQGERMWSENLRLRLAYHRKHFGMLSYRCARIIHILTAAWNSVMIAQRAVRDRENFRPDVCRKIGNLWRNALQPVKFSGKSRS